MSLILYSAPLSPPSRAAEACLRYLRLNAKIQYVDLVGMKHREPSYRQINPQHTVPTLVDGNTTIWHSGNIMQYVVDKYKPNSTLYPSDLNTRAKINQYLFFSSGNLFYRFFFITEAIFFFGATEILQEKIDGVDRVLATLEATIKHCSSKDKFLVGDNITIADLSVAAITTAANVVFETPHGKYPYTSKWLDNFKESLPEYDKFYRGARGIGRFFCESLEKNRQAADLIKK